MNLQSYKGRKKAALRARGYQLDSGLRLQALGITMQKLVGRSCICIPICIYTDTHIDGFLYLLYTCVYIQTYIYIYIHRLIRMYMQMNE